MSVYKSMHLISPQMYSRLTAVKNLENSDSDTLTIKVNQLNQVQNDNGGRVFITQKNDSTTPSVNRKNQKPQTNSIKSTGVNNVNTNDVDTNTIRVVNGVSNNTNYNTSNSGDVSPRNNTNSVGTQLQMFMHDVSTNTRRPINVDVGTNTRHPNNVDVGTNISYSSNSVGTNTPRTNTTSVGTNTPRTNTTSVSTQSTNTVDVGTNTYSSNSVGTNTNSVNVDVGNNTNYSSDSGTQSEVMKHDVGANTNYSNNSDGTQSQVVMHDTDTNTNGIQSHSIHNCVDIIEAGTPLIDSAMQTQTNMLDQTFQDNVASFDLSKGSKDYSNAEAAIMGLPTIGNSNNRQEPIFYLSSDRKPTYASVLKYGQPQTSPIITEIESTPLNLSDNDSNLLQHNPKVVLRPPMLQYIPNMTKKDVEPNPNPLLSKQSDAGKKKRKLKSIPSINKYISSNRSSNSLQFRSPMPLKRNTADEEYVSPVLTKLHHNIVRDEIIDDINNNNNNNNKNKNITKSRKNKYVNSIVDNINNPSTSQVYDKTYEDYLGRKRVLNDILKSSKKIKTQVQSNSDNINIESVGKPNRKRVLVEDVNVTLSKEPVRKPKVKKVNTYTNRFRLNTPWHEHNYANIAGVKKVNRKRSAVEDSIKLSKDPMSKPKQKKTDLW